MTREFKEFIMTWFNDKLFAADVVENPSNYPNLVYGLRLSYDYERLLSK